MKLPEGWEWVSMGYLEDDYLERRDGATVSQQNDGTWEAEAPGGTILRDPKIRGPISAARALNEKYPLEVKRERPLDK